MKSIIYLVLLFLTIVTFSQTYNGSINNVKYLSDLPDGTDISSNLRSIIGQSQNNDVIVLPVGKFIISGQININNKQISIIGQGADSIKGTLLFKSTISSDYSYIFSFNDISSLSSPIIISGIYFKSLKSLRYGGSQECF